MLTKAFPSGSSSNRLRRGALVLALLVLAATVAGVAESATKTAIPKQLARRWWQPSRQGKLPVMVVSRGGRVEIDQSCSADAPATCTSYDDQAEFSHVTAHRLSISGIPSCSGMGRYRWTITQGLLPASLNHGYVLSLTKIHDACKARVGLFVDSWGRY